MVTPFFPPSLPLSRRTLLGGLLGTAALGLAGCSGGDQPAAEAPAPSSTEVLGRTNLEILAWTNGPTIDDNFKKRVAQFNTEMAGKFTAKINFLPYDQYWQKVQLQYAANKPFDIYYWDVQAYAHFKKGLVLNQQPAVDATEMVDAAKYPTTLYDPWKFDGTNLYCVPENIQSMALFYNKSHFDEAGIGYPDATWTWDKVAEVAPQLTKKTGDRVTQWGLDIGDLGVWWGIQTLAWAAGTAFVDKPLEPTAFQMTDPKVVEAMTFVQDLMWSKHIAPRPEERAAVNENNGGFASGTYSMMPGGTWNIAAYTQMKDEWAMAPLPLYQGTSTAPYWLGGWVVPAKSGAISAAQAFALWSATGFQPTMAKNHDWIPLQNSARGSGEMLDGMPDGFTEAMENLPNARIGDIYTGNMQQIFNEVFGPNFDQMFNNKLSPADAAQKMQDAATKLLT